MVTIRTGEAQLDTSVHRFSTPEGLNTATNGCFQLLWKNRKEREKLQKEEQFPTPQAWRGLRNNISIKILNYNMIFVHCDLPSQLLINGFNSDID